MTIKKVPYSATLQKAVDTLLTKPAITQPELRQATTTYAEKLRKGINDPADIPADLEPYLKKVTLHAYRTTDQDVEQLGQAGYSEDEIFELTLCAALGAGLTHLECGLAALKGA